MDIKDSYLHGTVGVVKSIDVDGDKIKYTLADVANTTKMVALPLATTTNNGLLSNSDKIKLNTLGSAAYTSSDSYVQLGYIGTIIDVVDLCDKLQSYFGDTRVSITQLRDERGYLGHLLSRFQNPDLGLYTVDGCGLFLSGNFIERWDINGKNTTDSPLVYYKYKIYDEDNLRVVSSSANGLAPKVINTNTATVGSAYYVLASTNGSATPSWYKLPVNAFANDDTKVTQTNTTENAYYRVLLSGNANDTTETTTSRKAANLIFNPNTEILSTTYVLAQGLKGKAESLENLMKTGVALAYNRFSAVSFSNETGITALDNANGVLWVGTHVSESSNTSGIGYGHMLGFSGSGGALYHKVVTNGNTTGSWRKIAYTTTNFPSNQINVLTGYSKATSAGNVADADTLNTALGKLEYKAHYAYDWVIGVTATDTDEYINKWNEIVGFLDSVKEGTDILDEFVTRKTDLNIVGLKTFKAASTQENPVGVALKLGNRGLLNNMQTAIDFYNGRDYKVPNARISVLMNGIGNRGGTMIFSTQTKHESTNPNPNDLVERMRIDDEGLIKISGALTVNGNVTGAKFIGPLEGNADTASKLGTVDKGSTIKPIYLSKGTPTEGSTYAGGTAVTLNGVSKATTTASFYAPTNSGNSGQILVSQGSGSPVWKNMSLPYSSGSNSGDNDNSWYLLAELTRPKESSNITCDALFYLTDSYQRRNYGLLRVDTRIEANSGRVTRIEPVWLVNKGFNSNTVVATYKYVAKSENEEGLTYIRLYVQSANHVWYGIRCIKVSDGGFNLENNLWKLLSLRFTDIPSDETIYISTNAVLNNSLANSLTFNAGTFATKTYNGSAAVTVNVPTKTSHLTNDSGFLTLHQSLDNYVTTDTKQDITGLKTFKNITKIVVTGSSALILQTKSSDTSEDLQRMVSLGMSCDKATTNEDGSVTTTTHSGYFVYRGDSNYKLTDAGWNKEHTILHSGNSNINNGVITINGSSITPVTTNSLSTTLSNYVTITGDQIISGQKSFSKYTLVYSIASDGFQYGVRLLGHGAAGYLQLGQITSSGDKVHIGYITGIDSSVLNTLSVSATVSSFSGTVTATKLITKNGTSSQFVKGDGSLDDSEYFKYIGNCVSESNADDLNLGIYLNTTGSGSNNYNFPLTYGYLINFSRDTDEYKGFLMHCATNGYKLLYRSSWTYGNPLWSDWITLLNSENYTDYTVTKTGTGATGTWGINISGSSGSCTGNAATATTLKPTAVISAKAFSLINTTWTDTGYTFANLTTGTYAIQVTSGTNLVASGIMSVYKNLSDSVGDEIPLHVYGTAGWRPYLRTYQNKLLISSNDTSTTSRTVTIKIALIL